MHRPDYKTKKKLFFQAIFFMLDKVRKKQGNCYDFKSQSIRGMKVISIPSMVFVSDISRVST